MKNKAIKLTLLSSLVLACLGLINGSLTFNAAHADTNLVLNPSFEIAGSGGSRDAANWNEGTDHTRSMGKFVSGSWGLRSTFLGDHTTTRTAAPIPVSPNTAYLLSGYIWKSATNPGSNACIDMNDLQGEVQLCANLRATWQFKSGTWNSGSNTSVTLRLITDGTPDAGSWFDDISLMPVASRPTATETTMASPSPSPTSRPPTPTLAVTPITVTIAAAGDIACGIRSTITSTTCKALDTSDLLIKLDPDLVLAMGDNQYEAGSLSDFNQFFDNTWGRLKNKLRPVVGNHEYFNLEAAGYFDYFNGVGIHTGVAGDRGKGYYSYNLGNWHLIAANTNCEFIGGCGVGSPQYTWLQNDLVQDKHSCTLLYMHHAFSASDRRGYDLNPLYQPLVQLFYDDGGELLLVGHSHFYERFARMDANKQADALYGFRQIVVGTGGRSTQRFVAIRPLSQVRSSGSFGVIKLTLGLHQYSWEFISIPGQTFTDSGTEHCHKVHP